jgi:hypothetical protein
LSGRLPKRAEVNVRYGSDAVAHARGERVSLRPLSRRRRGRASIRGRATTGLMRRSKRAIAQSRQMSRRGCKRPTRRCRARIVALTSIAGQHPVAAIPPSVQVSGVGAVRGRRRLARGTGPQ